MTSSRTFSRVSAHIFTPKISQVQLARSLKVLKASKSGREDMSEMQKVRICPRCGGSQIKEASSTVSGWLVPKTYFCPEEKCGYSGSVYVEVDAEEAENLRRAINGDKKNAS